MPYRNKYKKKQLLDFLRYQRGEMSGSERNSFERELQKDPFSEEAAEGFSQISAEDAEMDISALQKLLDKRLSRRSSFVFYRIAAAVAVLMVISTIFIITHRKTEVVTLSENTIKGIKKPLEISVPEPIIALSDRGSDKKESIPVSAPQKSKTDDQFISADIAESETVISENSGNNKPALVQVAAEEVETKSVAAEKRMDMARAAGTPSSTKSEALRDYIPPQPVVGRDSFNLYLEKNTRNPEPGKSVQEIVVISFNVNADSTTTGLRIISSPGKAYSREATRLIKEGPQWKPALDNGKATTEQVRITVIFR